MSTFSDTAREAGRKMRAAKNKQRVVLAKKYGLKTKDFWPVNIQKTLAAHTEINMDDIPATLWKDHKHTQQLVLLRDKKSNGETSFPLEAIPERGPKRVYTKKQVKAEDPNLRAIVHDLLDIIRRMV